MSIEQKVGELMGHAEAMDKKLDRLLDLIPVVAVHQEKHNDIEENHIPRIDTHDKNFERIGGVLKFCGIVFTGTIAVLGVVVTLF